MGTPIGNSGLLTTAWCAAIAAGGYLWARGLYNRKSARSPATTSTEIPASRVAQMTTTNL